MSRCKRNIFIKKIYVYEKYHENFFLPRKDAQFLLRGIVRYDIVIQNLCGNCSLMFPWEA